MKMKNFIKLIEIAWLVIACISMFETYNNWVNNRNKSYWYGFIAVVAIVMYFFRKWQRKKIESNAS